jgi:ribosomal protein L5
MANPRIKDKYLTDIVPALKDKFQYKSVMQVPKITKIVINKGSGPPWPTRNWLTPALKKSPQLRARRQ